VFVDAVIYLDPIIHWDNKNRRNIHINFESIWMPQDSFNIINEKSNDIYLVLDALTLQESWNDLYII